MGAEIAGITGALSLIDQVGRNAKANTDKNERDYVMGKVSRGEELTGYEAGKYPDLAQQAQLAKDRKIQETKQKELQGDYMKQMEELNKQFEMGISENQYADKAGNIISENNWLALDPAQQKNYTAKPTNLGNMMSQIINNFMTTSTTAIRQWAYERGVAGSTIEGQAVTNAAEGAQKQAMNYKSSEASRLSQEKAQNVNAAKTAYDMGMEIPRSNINLDTAALNRTKSTETAGGETDWLSQLGNMSPDLLALTKNIDKALNPGTTTGQQGESGSDGTSGSNVLDEGVN